MFETCEAGVSSAVAPELLPQNQNAWGVNIDVRGGKPATRPNFRRRLNLPPGLIQGAEFFSVQSGMIICSIAGRIYRLRIGENDFGVEAVTMDFQNSGLIKQVWMTQTVETLVIQDGQSNALMYDGSILRRAISGQVPRGRQMAYGNGRLWVSVNANEVVAGDIRSNLPGSELAFTEANYLTGGGRLYFPRETTGMAFIPLTGQSDYGALLVFGAGETQSIRADITNRDQWGQIPGFVSSILRSVGAASQWSIVSVNQDLYWRDSNGGIRSIRNALADEMGPGSAPISREVSRLTDYDSTPQLVFCSGVYFDNRLLMTSSPYLLPNGGVAFKNLISLDYAPLSVMGHKSPAAYNGQWSGLNFVKLVGGLFNGRNRAFALTTSDEGVNQLWEFGTRDRADIYAICDGTADDPTYHENPITCAVEYPLRDFGQSKTRKRIERCDVWLSAVNGPVDLKVYWRADNSVQWNLWDEAATCAQTTDASVAVPHIWKNLSPQERPQFKTFTIPDGTGEQTKYALQVGFEFQIRLVWTGRCRIHRMMAYGTMLSDPDFADRSGFEIECVEQSVHDNEVIYKAPTNSCPLLGVYFPDGAGGYAPLRFGALIGFGGWANVEKTFQICNNENFQLVDVTIELGQLCIGAFEITTPPPTTINAGGCVTFGITYHSSIPCPNGSQTAVIIKTSRGTFFEFTVDDSTHPTLPTFDSQPSDVTVEPGGNASFNAVVHGTNPIVYQWQVSGDGGVTWNNVVDDTVYSGSLTTFLTITGAALGLTGNKYRLRATNEWGARYSDPAILTVALGYLTLPPPIGASPYANLGVASGVMAAQVSNCVGFVESDGSVTAFSASPISNGASFSATGSSIGDSPTCVMNVWCGLNLKAGAIITINRSAAGGILDSSSDLINSAGVYVDSKTGAGPMFLTCPADGNYEIRVSVISATPNTPPFTSFSISAISNLAATNLPIRAAYGVGPSYLGC